MKKFKDFIVEYKFFPKNKPKFKKKDFILGTILPKKISIPIQSKTSITDIFNKEQL